MNKKTAPVPVFDIGGVLLDWDPRYLYRKIFKDEVEMEQFLGTVCTTDWNRQQDAGRTWAEAVKELTGRHPDKAALIEAYDQRWPEMIRRALDGTVAILQELKAKGPVYSITNFSGEKFVLAKKLWPFLNLFDGVIVSGDVKMIKPDAGIYQRLLKDFKLDAQNCLFIDDVPANVEAARAAGMQAVVFASPEKLRADLRAAGLL